MTKTSLLPQGKKGRLCVDASTTGLALNTHDCFHAWDGEGRKVCGRVVILLRCCSLLFATFSPLSRPSLCFSHLNCATHARVWPDRVLRPAGMRLRCAFQAAARLCARSRAPRPLRCAPLPLLSCAPIAGLSSSFRPPRSVRAAARAPSAPAPASPTQQQHVGSDDADELYLDVDVTFAGDGEEAALAEAHAALAAELEACAPALLQAVLDGDGSHLPPPVQALRDTAAGCELCVTLCDDGYITHLNTTWRQLEEATDVLSFPLLEAEAPPGGYLLPDGHAALGDIVISLDTARRQADARGHSLEEEVQVLLVHGVLHLVGYDHEQGEEAARLEWRRRRRVSCSASAGAHGGCYIPSRVQAGRRQKRRQSRAAEKRTATHAPNPKPLVFDLLGSMFCLRIWTARC